MTGREDERQPAPEVVNAPTPGDVSDAAPDANAPAYHSPATASGDADQGMVPTEQADVDAAVDDRMVVTEAGTVEQLPKGILAGNPKLQILLIAAIFYAILIGMCLTIGIIVFRDS